MLKRSLNLALAFVLFIFLVPPRVHAYLDPGSGSYLIQIIIASLAGAGFFLKTNWQKVKNIFSKKNKSNSNEKEAE